MKTYTFHVSIPGTGRVWRKIELVEDHTLEDLHWAIQEAFDFGGDHLYSFFMSGKAWDRSTEYALPGDAFQWDDDEFELVDDTDDDDEFEDVIDEESAKAIIDALGDTPPPETFEDMLALLSTNADLRGEMVKVMAEQTGIPAFMADMLLKNATSLMGGMSEDMDMMGGLFADDEPAGDVRKTELESLALQPGQSFMYLFDYGDEWRFQVKVDKVGDDMEPGVEYPRIVQSVGEAPSQYPDWDEDDDDEESEGYD